MLETKIKAYFLGELDVEESDKFEESLALDPDLTELASAVEVELIHDYLQNRMSPNERVSFEKNYLTTPGRTEKLKSEQVFLNVLREKPDEIIEQQEKGTFFQSFFADLRPFPVIAFGALCLLLAGGLILIFWMNRQSEDLRSQQGNGDRSPRPTISPVESPSPFNSNTEVSPGANTNGNDLPAAPKPSPSLSPTPLPKERMQPVFASFNLLPGTLRSGGEQLIKITAQTGTVELALELPNDTPKFAAYRAILKTAEGRTIFTSKNLRSPRVTLPSRTFSNRIYILFLEGSDPNQPSEPVAEYTFRVTR